MTVYWFWGDPKLNKTGPYRTPCVVVLAFSQCEAEVSDSPGGRGRGQSSARFGDILSHTQGSDTSPRREGLGFILWPPDWKSLSVRSAAEGSVSGQKTKKMQSN